MSPVISVIIPIYNIQDYLPKCISSVVKQTYKKIEIILVDDGSTDNCLKICESFCHDNKNIRVIHQKNSGLSAARNVGLKNASGEYIFFLDGDDWIDETCLEKLMNLVMHTKSQIAICDHMECKRNEGLNKSCNSSYEVLSKRQAQEEILYMAKVPVYAWGKLYDRKILRDIAFPEGKLFEDQVPTFLAISAADKVVVLHETLYAYSLRNDSILHKKYTSRNMDAVEQNEILLDYVKKEYPRLVTAAKIRLLWESLYTLAHIDDLDLYKTDYKVCWRHIKQYRIRAIFNHRCSNKIRFTCIISFCGARTLQLAYRIYADYRSI